LKVVALVAVPFWAIFSQYPQPVDLAAQARQESRFQVDAVSPVGAQGLCQFMPGTWREAIRRGWVPPHASPLEPEHAIKAQAAYMSYLRTFFRGDKAKALAAYNAGEGRVRRAERMAMARGISDSDARRAWLELCPAETRGYVQRIETVHVPWVSREVARWTWTTHTMKTHTGCALLGRP
jgi:membrane-bound lytic murein transglycosylase MltF